MIIIQISNTRYKDILTRQSTGKVTFYLKVGLDNFAIRHTDTLLDVLAETNKLRWVFFSIHFYQNYKVKSLIEASSF